MPSKPTKPKPSRAPAAKTQPKNSKPIRLLLLFIVLAAAISFALIHHNQQAHKRQAALQLAADKAAFATVEAEMSKAYDAIVASAGKPAKEQRFKSCSRIAHKYSQGELFCGQGYTFDYLEKNLDAIVPNAQLVEAALKGASFQAQDHSGLATGLHTDAGFQSLSKVYMIDIKGIRCELNLTLRPFTNKSELVGQDGAATEQYSFRCSKEVNEPVYPLAS